MTPLLNPLELQQLSELLQKHVLEASPRGAAGMLHQPVPAAGRPVRAPPSVSSSSSSGAAAGGAGAAAAAVRGRLGCAATSSALPVSAAPARRPPPRTSSGHFINALTGPVRVAPPAGGGGRRRGGGGGGAVAGGAAAGGPPTPSSAHHAARDRRSFGPFAAGHRRDGRGAGPGPATAPTGGRGPRRSAADSKESRESLAQRAVDDIKALLLAEAPEANHDGPPVPALVPPDWSVRYAPTLGRYKHFLMQYPTEFEIGPCGDQNFTVKVAQGARPLHASVVGLCREGAGVVDAAAGGGGPQEPWATDLRAAWAKYTSARGGPSTWSLEDFLSAAPEAASRIQRPPSTGRRRSSGGNARPVWDGGRVRPEPGPKGTGLARVDLPVKEDEAQVNSTVKEDVKEEEEEDVDWTADPGPDAAPVAADAGGSGAGPSPDDIPISPGPPWVVIEHPEHPGQYYFFNEESEESVWEVPNSENGPGSSDEWRSAKRRRNA